MHSWVNFAVAVFVAFSALAGGQLACAADEAAEPIWRECPDGFQYTGKVFGIVVARSGQIKNIRFYGMTIISDMQLYGRYLSDEKHDARFFQCGLADEKPLMALDDGNGAIMIKKEGFLKNKKHPKAARFEQTLRLTEQTLEFEYKLVPEVTLVSRRNVFVTLAYLPPETFANRGYALERSDKPAELKVFPAEYSKESDIRTFAAKTLKVVFDKSTLGIMACGDSVIAISDARSYGSEYLRLDFQPPSGWHKDGLELEKGTQLGWTFKLTALQENK